MGDQHLDFTEQYDGHSEFHLITRMCLNADNITQGKFFHTLRNVVAKGCDFTFRRWKN